MTMPSHPRPSARPAAQDIYTAGIFIKQSPTDWQNLDFGLQFYGQFGNFKDFRTPAASRLDHAAYAGIASVGYTWKESSLSPRLGIEYSYASGDEDPTDDEHGTFVHLYPTGHLFYGYADFSSLQNVHNVRLQSSVMLTAAREARARGAPPLARDGQRQLLQRRRPAARWRGLPGTRRARHRLRHQSRCRQLRRLRGGPACSRGR